MQAHPISPLGPVKVAITMDDMLMWRGVPVPQNYSALGIASAFYAGILMLFCRVQERTIMESFSIRFQNEELWLVPEVASGSMGEEHRYESPQIQTFVFYVQ